MDGWKEEEGDGDNALAPLLGLVEIRGRGRMRDVSSGVALRPKIRLIANLIHFQTNPMYLCYYNISQFSNYRNLATIIAAVAALPSYLGLFGHAHMARLDHNTPMQYFFVGSIII